MRKLKKVIKELQGDLDFAVAKLIKESGLRKIKVQGAVVNQKRGWSYKESGLFTIPLWAYSRGRKYFAYYISHELSHQYAGRFHDNQFYYFFKILCPKESQHFEVRYKPVAAKRNGIKKESEIWEVNDSDILNPPRVFRIKKMEVNNGKNSIL